MYEIRGVFIFFGVFDFSRNISVKISPIFFRGNEIKFYFSPRESRYSR